jgi:hypothetical protein
VRLSLRLPTNSGRAAVIPGSKGIADEAIFEPASREDRYPARPGPTTPRGLIARSKLSRAPDADRRPLLARCRCLLLWRVSPPLD